MTAPVDLRRIGLVVHGGKPQAVATAGTISAWAQAHHVQTTLLDVWSVEAARRHAREEAAAAGVLDLIVTVGGDGTFLRGARLAASVDVPVLGVDLGRVGFLTDVPADLSVEAITAYVRGQAVIEERLLLTMRSNRPLEIPADVEALLRYGRGPALPAPRVHASAPEVVGWGHAIDVVALNDVVFEKFSRDRQASLALYLDGRLFASYSADALIVATPTGSTAYSFAAGGPVVSPRARVLIVTPVAAHMTFDRSLLLAADERAAVRVLERSGRVAVSVDGQVRGVLEPGDWVAVYASPHPVRIVRRAEPDFFGRVRDRFRVADATAAQADGEAPATYRPGLPVPPDLAHLHISRPAPPAAASGQQPG